MPTTVGLPIPASAGTPHAVAKKGQEGSLLLAKHRRQVDGNWATIHVETDSPDIQLEFYAALDVDRDQRAYTFTWPGGLRIEELAYEIQEPAGAVGFSVSPPGLRRIGTDGLAYHHASLGTFPAEATWTVQIRYVKSTFWLTQQSMKPTQAAEPSPPRTSVPAGQPGAGPNWLLIVVVAGLGVAAGVWLARAWPGKTPSA
jgi:hypothetical protein